LCGPLAIPTTSVVGYGISSLRDFDATLLENSSGRKNEKLVVGKIAEVQRRIARSILHAQVNFSGTHFRKDPAERNYGDAGKEGSIQAEF